jgi:hypothetical protein
VSLIRVRVPKAVHERLKTIPHDERGDVCAAALVLFFNADADTQWAFRRWAVEVRIGWATVDKPSAEVAQELAKVKANQRRRRRKA